MRFTDGFTARIRSDVERLGPDLLLGGSPLRTMRLTSTARKLVDGDLVTVRDRRTDQLAARLVDGNLADPVLESIDDIEPEDLTVVIPARDRADQLARALAPLRGLRCIVVDDASCDPDAVAAVAAAYGAEVLALTENVGPAGARNAGLATVRTPYVAFVDSDVEVASNALLRLARHFADANVALAGPRVRGRAIAAQPKWFERYDVEASSLSVGDRAGSVRPGATVAWLPSACLVGRVEHLGAGFAEDMRVGEDVDLVWRLVDSGLGVRYDPSETALHDTRTTVRDWLGRKFLYGTSGAELAARHGDNVAPAVLSPTMAIVAAAVLLRRRWLLPVALGGLAVSARGLNRRLPESPQRSELAVRLTVKGLGWAVRQESALLLRHWWPLAAAAAIPSRTVRRAIVSALAVDVVVARVEHPAASYAPVSRRLDDLAYGAGLWAGAWRRRSLAALLPRRPGVSTAARPPKVSTAARR